MSFLDIIGFYPVDNLLNIGVEPLCEVLYLELVSLLDGAVDDAMSILIILVSFSTILLLEIGSNESDLGASSCYFYY